MLGDPPDAIKWVGCGGGIIVRKGTSMAGVSEFVLTRDFLLLISSTDLPAGFVSVDVFYT